jgi:type IV pilus assembly protein PilF
MRAFLHSSWLTLLLAGCVQDGVAPATVSRTASDQSDADRRAAPRMELASLYFSRGQYETALDEVKQAIAARPDLGAAYNLRGLIYAAMGEDLLADESFARALAINPRDADSMHNRAWSLCQRNQFDDANRYFEQALAQPQYRDGTRTMMAQGVCLARAGKLTEAERKLTLAYEADPGNPTTVINLADVLYRRGEYERARFYVRRVNGREELTSASSLWLALRIENRIGNRGGVEDLGRQLRQRFPQTPEARLYEQRRFDE